MASLNGIKQELTQEQLQIIAAEITKPNYLDISPGGICQMLNNKPLIDNPELQGTIQPSTIVSSSEVLELISWANLKKTKKNADGAIALEFLIDLGEVDLTQANVTDALNDILGQGLIDQLEVDNLMAKISEISDPDWQAQILGQSKTEELLGDNWVIEGADIRGAQAL
jgi:hypothetical protein